MLTLTPLHRAILDALDKAEHGAGDTELCEQLSRAAHDDEFLHAVVELLDENLIDARFRDALQDRAVSEDPIIYSLSETGADALWALLRAEAGAMVDAWANNVPGARLAHPVHFTSRAAMREFLRSAA